MSLFVGEDRLLQEMPPGTFSKPKFFDYMKEEYLACREGVGIIDMSSFSKIELNVCVTPTYLQIIPSTFFLV